MKTTILCSLFLTASLASAAPLGKGWHRYQPENSGMTKEALARHVPGPGTAASTLSTGTVQTATATLDDPDFAELEALAHGLKYDPLEIYRHVRSNYDYNAYSGIVKGALQTFYDRQGNDWDLSILTAKLLEISQAHNTRIESVELVHAHVLDDDSEIARWLGCENKFTVISDILHSAGLAFYYHSLSVTWVERSWVRVTIDGEEHDLDVGWKQYDTAGPVDLDTATGFLLTALQDDAGGSTGSDWVSGLNESNVRDYLNARTIALQGYLRDHHANDTCFEVLGGKQRLPETITALPTLLGRSYSQLGTYTLAALPAEEISTIRLQHAGIDQTYPIHEIAGRSIALTYADSSTASLNASRASQAEAVQTLLPAPKPVLIETPSMAIPAAPKAVTANPETAANADATVDFGRIQQGRADVLNGYQYINPADNWQVRLESRILSGSNAFRPQYTSPKYHSKGDDLILAAYFKSSTLARGSYSGQIVHELYWNDWTAPFETIVHDLTGTIAQVPGTISYSGGLAQSQPGNSSSFTLSLTNPGPLSMGLRSVSLSGTHADRFSFVSGHGSSTIPSGGTHTFTLDYSPTAEGSHTASVNMILSYDGLDYTFSLPISGESRNYPAAQLWIDGVLIAFEADTSDASEVEPFTLTIDHPGTSYDQSAAYNVKRGASYVLANDFGASRWGHRLKNLQQKLSRLRASGAADNSREVLTATLDVMGQTWMQQTSQGTDLYRLVTQSENNFRHRFGLAAQEEGYYIDVAHQVSATHRLHSAAPEGRPLFRLTAQTHSALEHGVLEQMQVNRPATSTVGILRLANDLGHRIYRMDADNVDTLTDGVLINYEATVLEDFKEQIANENARIILPQDGKLPYNEWEGYGYVAQHIHENGQTVAMRMGISGDYGDLNGGYGATREDINPQWVYDNYYPDTFDFSEVPHPLSEEPVDLATGAYLFDHLDLAIGQPEPRGIRFARTYNSFNTGKDHGLGHGWDHNWNAYITEYSEADHGLLLRRPEDAAPHIIAAQALLQLELSPADDAKTWALKSLVADWATDQLDNNALAVHIHGKVLVYTRMPDGSFLPPPGVTTDLVQTADGYELRGRFGTVQTFAPVNGTHRLTAWQDVDGKQLTVSYSGDKPSVITDAYGRSFTLAYTNDRLTTITDSTGRSVSYTYSPDGDQTAFTNADGQTNTLFYDDKHRIIELRDPDDRIITQNFYNDSNRVYRQLSEGSKEWLFHYSDYQMIERDPTQAEKRYEYNERKQLLAFTDAEGNRSSTTFNGHERPRQTTDPRTVPTDYQYDNHLNLLSQTVSLDGGHDVSTSFAYDPQHRMTSQTDPEGNTATHTYDAQHRRTRSTNPIGEAVTYTYTADGQLHTTTETDAAGTTHTTTYSYDEYGNQNRITYPDGTTEAFTFNARGQRTSQTDRRGHTTTYTLDNRGNVIATTFPLEGITTAATYDYAGNPLTATGPRGYTTRHTYSPMFKRTDTTIAHGDPGGSFTTTFGYDEPRPTHHRDHPPRPHHLRNPRPGRAHHRSDHTPRPHHRPHPRPKRKHPLHHHTPRSDHHKHLRPPQPAHRIHPPLRQPRDRHPPIRRQRKPHPPDQRKRPYLLHGLRPPQPHHIPDHTRRQDIHHHLHPARTNPIPQRTLRTHHHLHLRPPQPSRHPGRPRCHRHLRPPRRHSRPYRLHYRSCHHRPRHRPPRHPHHHPHPRSTRARHKLHRQQRKPDPVCL
jgi:YD repeat-containing protein